MSAPALLFPAFKEWAVIVEALGSGAQIIILRKGGIAEGREGFQIKHKRFWLFPTQYHQQLTKTNLAAEAYADSLKAGAQTIDLHYFADITDVRYLETEEQLAAIDELHLWKKEVVTERFHYGSESGLHLIVVRLHQLAEVVSLPLNPAYEGCKSWVEVPVDFEANPSQPVLTDAAFNEQRTALLDRLK